MPMWGNVLIETIATTTKGGITLPENLQNQDHTARGRIVAAGPGSIAFDGSIIPMECKVGDIVVFKKYEAEPIKNEDKNFFLVDQRQIMVKFIT